MVGLLAGAIFRREFFWREIIWCVFYFGRVSLFFFAGVYYVYREPRKSRSEAR